jgi:hypothetical protein
VGGPVVCDQAGRLSNLAASPTFTPISRLRQVRGRDAPVVPVLLEVLAAEGVPKGGSFGAGSGTEGNRCFVEAGV